MKKCEKCNRLENDLVTLEKIARDAPELNLSNYDHDDVCRLDAAMCEMYEILRKYRRPTKTCVTCKREFTPEPGAEGLAQCIQCWNTCMAIPPPLSDGEVDEAIQEIEREGRAV